MLVFRSPLPPCTYAADAPAGSCYAKNEWVLTEASLGATVGPLGHHSDVLLRRARSASAPKRSCRRVPGVETEIRLLDQGPTGAAGGRWLNRIAGYLSAWIADTRGHAVAMVFGIRVLKLAAVSRAASGILIHK